MNHAARTHPMMTAADRAGHHAPGVVGEGSAENVAARTADRAGHHAPGVVGEESVTESGNPPEVGGRGNA